MSVSLWLPGLRFGRVGQPFLQVHPLLSAMGQPGPAAGGIMTDVVPAPGSPTVWGLMLEPKEGQPMGAGAKGVREVSGKK